MLEKKYLEWELKHLAKQVAPRVVLDDEYKQQQ